MSTWLEDPTEPLLTLAKCPALYIGNHMMGPSQLLKSLLTRLIVKMRTITPTGLHPTTHEVDAHHVLVLRQDEWL